jgi:hypothetical protein
MGELSTAIHNCPPRVSNTANMKPTYNCTHRCKVNYMRRCTHLGIGHKFTSGISIAKSLARRDDGKEMAAGHQSWQRSIFMSVTLEYELEAPITCLPDHFDRFGSVITVCIFIYLILDRK